MTPSIKRTTAVSTANAPVTVSDAGTTARRLLFATVSYSATVTQTCTLTLNSGAGAGWDTEIGSVAVTATDGVFMPTNDVLILADDSLDFLAPAGGVGITANVAIYTEVL